jgi:hypothetical protein
MHLESINLNSRTLLMPQNVPKNGRSAPLNSKSVENTGVGDVPSEIENVGPQNNILSIQVSFLPPLSGCIMFTPARDFLLETPWRIIIPEGNVSCEHIDTTESAEASP